MPFVRETKEYLEKCSRCKREFRSAYAKKDGVDIYCGECVKLISTLNQLERQLLAEEFSIGQEDEKMAQQMNSLLVKESTGVSEKDEELLTALTERMLKDEKRRKKLIREILKLQKKKR